MPTRYHHRLGEGEYRRSETPYLPGVSVAARVGVCVVDGMLVIVAEVDKTSLSLRDPSAPDPRLDNESPDIHADGLQCYVGRSGWTGIVVTPRPEDHGITVRRVPGPTGGITDVSGAWQRTETGYAVRVALRFDRPIEQGERFPGNVVINEMYPQRTRRSGQLVLSGDRGWVYLRGDRESADGAVMLEVE